MTQPRRRALPIAVVFAALTAACGGGVTLPEEGEAANLTIVDGNEQVGPAGTALAEPVVVKVTDSQNRPVPNQNVTFVIQSGGGSVEPETFTTGNDGLASATWTLGPNAGGQQLRARTPRGGGSTLLEVTFTADAVAGSGSVLSEVAGDEQTGPVNSALADSLVVRTTDALGNPVANVEVTWSVSGGGSISPVTVITDDDGLAAAERVLGPTAGTQSAQATVEGFTGSPVTFTHTAIPANPTVLRKVSGDEQIAPAGFEVAEDLVVRLEDPNGNGIGGRPITWVVPSGSGSVDPVSTTTDANGLATTRWTLPGSVGQYTVSAVFSGLAPVVFTATATADAPTTIEMVSGNGQSATVATALTNPLVVRVTDANDNPVSGVSVLWTAEGGGTVDGAATTNTATNASGLAQVTRVLGPTPQQYTTTAAVDGLEGSPVTFVSTATAGAPAKLALITAPGSPTVSGTAFSPSPVIQVQDAQGNNVSQGGITVSVAVSSGQAATLENDSRNTNSNGRVTFSNLRITGSPDDDYVLTFSASFGGSPLTPVSTGNLVVTAGAAARLIVTTQPSATAQSGVQFDRQPVVQVVDATGNPISGNRTINVELVGSAGDLEGVLDKTTGGGSTATFTDLAISAPVGTYTLRFTSGSLTPAESNVIQVTTGPATDIDIQAGNGQNAPAGTTVTTDPAVIIRDSGGNPVAGVQVTFTVEAGNGSVGDNQVTTGSNGIASTSWTLGTTPGQNELRASSSVGAVTFTATGDPVSTTTELSAVPTPPQPSGTNVTFTATVTSGNGQPTGDVQFLHNGNPVGTETLSNGTASIQITLDANPFTVTANYLGDGPFAPSSDDLTYSIASINVPPEADADQFEVDEDGSLAVPAPGVLANDSDPDGDDLTAQLVAQPANGSVALDEDGSFTYTPDDDFNGTDAFTYRASDGESTSPVATVTIAVQAVNDPPFFTPGPDIAVNTLQALDFESQWATGVGPGPPDEAGQVLSFQVSLENPTADAGAFLEPPQISPDGILTFRAVALALVEDRIIPVRVVLSDGEDQTDQVTFTITIQPLLGP